MLLPYRHDVSYKEDVKTSVEDAQIQRGGKYGFT